MYLHANYNNKNLPEQTSREPPSIFPKTLDDVGAHTPPLIDLDFLENWQQQKNENKNDKHIKPSS